MESCHITEKCMVPDKKLRGIHDVPAKAETFFFGLLRNRLTDFTAPFKATKHFNVFIYKWSTLLF